MAASGHEFVSRDRLDRELADELEAHLEMHIDDNRRLGMSADEARRQALIKLGGMEQLKEEYRDRRDLPVLETALPDLRFAFRLMRRTPGFSAVILVTLAIGIGANTVMFSVVNTLLLRALPYHEQDRLMSVQTVNAFERAVLFAIVVEVGWRGPPRSARGEVLRQPA